MDRIFTKTGSVQIVYEAGYICSIAVQCMYEKQENIYEEVNGP
jgi:hypothetical protein